jgi:hypothetical protein
MEGSQLRHLKDVEAELHRLNRMYTELALEYHVLKNVFSLKSYHRPRCSKAVFNACTTKSVSARAENAQPTMQRVNRSSTIVR